MRISKVMETGQVGVEDFLWGPPCPEPHHNKEAGPPRNHLEKMTTRKKQRYHESLVSLIISLEHGEDGGIDY